MTERKSERKRGQDPFPLGEGERTGPPPPQLPAETFHVQLGHHRVTVRGRSPGEAIRAARQRLCEEMPRMWDMIQKADDRQFSVQRFPS